MINKGFHVFFTSLPIIIFAVYDQDVSVRTALKYPELYSMGRGISNKK